MPAPVLTPAQQNAYYASENAKALPLSPTAWLAAQAPKQPTVASATPVAAVTPMTPVGPKVTAPAPVTLAANATATPATLAPVPAAPVQPNYAATLSSIPTAESIMAEKSPDQIKAEAASQSLQERMLATIQTLTTRGAAQGTAEAAAGVPDLQKRLGDVNAQIKALQDEAQAIPIRDQTDAEGRGITAAGLAPLDAAKLRNNTVQALGLSAIASTLQGNLGAAQAQADKAVAAHFDPLQGELDYLKQAYDFNSSTLSEADKAEAAVIQQKLQERQSTIDTQKSDMQQSQKVAMDAAANGAPIALVQRALALPPTQATALLASYLPQSAKYQTLAPGASVYDPVTGKIVQTAPTTQAQNGGSAAVTFSETQLNKGAANAGMPIATFKGLDPDSQNYLINNFSTFAAQQKLIASGQKTPQEVAALITAPESTVPTKVQDVLLSLLGVTRASLTTAPKNDGIVSSVMNWLGGWAGKLTGI